MNAYGPKLFEDIYFFAPPLPRKRFCWTWGGEVDVSLILLPAILLFCSFLFEAASARSWNSSASCGGRGKAHANLLRKERSSNSCKARARSIPLSRASYPPQTLQGTLSCLRACMFLDITQLLCILCHNHGLHFVESYFVLVYHPSCSAALDCTRPDAPERGNETLLGVETWRQAACFCLWRP